MKDAYYFPHDANAHSDPKVLSLRVKHGWEGYGMYWAIVESLRDCTDYELPIDAIDGLCLRYGVANGVLMALFDTLYGVGLLSHNDTHFWSDSLKRRMTKLDASRKRMSDAGKRGAEHRWGSHATPIAIKESKVKNSKDIVDKRFIPPSIDEINLYIKEKSLKFVNGSQFLHYYEANGWKVGRNKMVNWKSAVSGWNARKKAENEPEKAPNPYANLKKSDML